MPLQFCPISFTLFPSIKWGGKTYSILMHIRGISGTSSGGIDHGQSAFTSYVPVTSIIRPRSCRLMQSRQVLLSSTPPSISNLPSLFIISVRCFPSSRPCLALLLHYLCPLLCPVFFSAYPPTHIPVLFPCLPSYFPTFLFFIQCLL